MQSKKFHICTVSDELSSRKRCLNVAARCGGLIHMMLKWCHKFSIFCSCYHHNQTSAHIFERQFCDKIHCENGLLMVWNIYDSIRIFVSTLPPYVLTVHYLGSDESAWAGCECVLSLVDTAVGADGYSCSFCVQLWWVRTCACTYVCLYADMYVCMVLCLCVCVILYGPTIAPLPTNTHNMHNAHYILV